jgi:hypothetical protein
MQKRCTVGTRLLSSVVIGNTVEYSKRRDVQINMHANSTRSVATDDKVLYSVSISFCDMDWLAVENACAHAHFYKLVLAFDEQL